MKPNEICRKRLIHTLHYFRQCGESMSEIPAELFYTKEHEWIRMDGDIATIGITDHAQDALTDIVYIELPEGGEMLEDMGEFAIVESVKSASLSLPLLLEKSQKSTSILKTHLN